MEPRTFQEGDLVTYIPNHAGDNAGHGDCEQGLVTEVRGEYVFVRFEGYVSAQACRPQNLIHG